MNYTERLKAYEKAKHELVKLRLSPTEYLEKLKLLAERWKI